MTDIPLGKVVTITGGGTPSRDIPEYFGGPIPWITVKDFGDRLFLDRAQESITELGLTSSASRLVPAGSVILVTRMAVGSVAINLVDVAINQDLKALQCSPALDPEYLLFFLLSKQEYLSSQASGATVKGIILDDIIDLQIPLPPLAEQRRIAAILRAADDERRRRRYTQSLSDGLLREVFVRMFGDPATNPMGWKQISLADVLISANDGPHVSPEYVECGVPFLSTRNIRPGQIVWEDMKYISAEDARIQWKKVKPARGDILYTKGGSTGLAKAVDFDREIAVWVHVAVLKIRTDQVVPVWLENMLNTEYCYAQSQELTMGIVNRDLGLQRMPKIQMYLPPCDLQHHFAELAAKYDQTRRQQQESARQSDHLFETLLHRAFAGEM